MFKLVIGLPSDCEMDRFEVVKKRIGGWTVSEGGVRYGNRSLQSESGNSLNILEKYGSDAL